MVDYTRQPDKREEENTWGMPRTHDEFGLPRTVQVGSDDGVFEKRFPLGCVPAYIGTF